LDKEIGMKTCCCGLILAVLVIVFAWWGVSWAPIALTILGVLLVIKALVGTCCCETVCKDMSEEPAEQEEQAAESD